MLVIPIFIPHWGCPHQCCFCNQKSIAGEKFFSSSFSQFETSFHQTIEEYLSYKGNRLRVELAFFGGNFLGLSRNLIVRLLDLAKPYLDRGQVHGLRCSTRPDTITHERLDLLFNRSFSLVEIGVQSMDDRVLEQSLRGHTKKDSLQALDCLAEHGIPSGVQVMAGLPGETRDGFVQGIEELAARKPVTARIYPLLVLSKSPLAALYQEGKYQPLDLEEAVSWVRDGYEIFIRNRVRVIRMGLQASDMLSDCRTVLAGPYHPAFGHLVFSSIFLQKTIMAIESWLSGRETEILAQEIQLVVHPGSESRLRGDKNANIHTLEVLFPKLSFSIARDEHMDRDEVAVIAA